MNVAENVKNIREKAGKTQKELAQAVYVDQAMICKIEKGIKLPSLSLSVAIAAALDCTVNDLVQ